MISVGITGQAGFIGSHLFNFLKTRKEQFQLIPFQDSFFGNPGDLENFVRQCDTVVHLAAMNRHNDPNTIYETNIRLVNALINACEKTGSTRQIIFSSSTQEERDNLYGKSKRDGRILFEKWAERNNASFTGLVIPNVFGPFGNPYYNSVVATFCHQLTHNELPRIDIDGEMKLIYVGELINEIYKHIGPQSETSIRHMVPHSSEIKVSELLAILEDYKSGYFEKGIIPDLCDTFRLNLFNTFLTYIDHGKFFPFMLKLNTDERGVYVETVKMNSGGQVAFSVTKPGITRGNHFHTRKAERFAVIKGKARIEIRRIGTEKKLSFDLDGTNPSFVDMPVWYTHNITNVGNEDVYTIFWINEFFNPDDTDTYFEAV